MDKITLGAAIIVGKDRLEQLKNLLPQLKDLDQVVVVNTQGQGSVRNLCHKFKNVTYVDFPWRDNPTGHEPNDWGFSAARNESFKHLTTTHAIWLDTDDLIGTEFAGREHALSAKGVRDVLTKIAKDGPDTDIWFFDYLYSHDEVGNVNVRHQRERFMRMDVGWKWIYPIHEVPAPSRAPKHAVVKDVVIIHQPTIDPAKAGERNYRMLDMWLKQLEERNLPTERHDLARARLMLGDTLWGMERYVEAAEWLKGEFLAKHPEALDIEKWNACIFAARSYISAGLLIKAREMALLGIAIEPGLADGYFLLAEIKMMMNDDPQDVLILMETGAGKEQPPSQMIKNPLDYTFTPFLITSEAKFQLGQFDAALDFALKAQEIRPTDKRAEEARVKAAQKVRERDATKAALALYQYLQDYDENEKAGHLYEVLPYTTQQNEDVRTVALATKKRITHLWDDKTFLALHNTEEFVASPFEWYESGYIPGRDLYSYVLRRLLPHGDKIKRVLWVGCHDGFHANLLAKAGYQVIGIDINEKGIAAAIESAGKLGLADQTEFICGYFERIDPTQTIDPGTGRPWFQSFDAVVALEYIHKSQLPGFTLGALADCAKEGAPIILSVPDGAFDKGDIPTSRNDDSARILRVFTQETFEALLLGDAEYRCIEAHFLPYTDSYREGQGWQVGEVRRVPTPTGPRVKIVCGNAVEPFNPDNLIMGEGVGGSETAVIHMSRHFAAMGGLVSVYGTCMGIWDGVFYRHFDDLDNQSHADIYIAWRLPLMFKDVRPNAVVTILWTHDLFYTLEVPPEWVERIDRIAVLSQFHKDYIMKVHGFPEEKMWVTRNGIDPARYTQQIEKRPYHYFYTSSYNRGLTELVAIWPEVRLAIPEATLHVGYGSKVAEEFYKSQRDVAALKDLAEFTTALNNTEGIIVHGRLNQWELAALQLSCQAWLYPYQQDWPEGGFLETYCITALEAQAAGCIPFTRMNGAIPEVVREAIPWKISTTTEDVIAWLGLIEGSFLEDRERNREWALTQSWESLAHEWMQEFTQIALTNKLIQDAELTGVR